MDLTNFNDYIARENKHLTKTLFAGGDTGKIALYMTGIKGSTVIPHLSGGASILSGNCPNPSGSTVMSQVEISVKPFTVYEEFCTDDLQSKYPNMVLAPGSNNEGDAPSEWFEALVDTKIASIQEQLETMYWSGTVAGGDLFDGYLARIDADANVIAGNTSAAVSITKANVIGLVDDMRAAAPAKVKRDKDFVVMVGDDVFDLYIAAQKDANQYHYDAEHDNGVLRVGGSGMRLVRVYGLNESDRMVAGLGKNLIVGSDVENESAVADMFYDKVTDKTYLRVKAKAGVQIANADEIVEWTAGV